MLATISSHHKSGCSLDHFKSKEIATDCVAGFSSVFPSDTVDNPVLKQLLLGHDSTEENILKKMKYESNRLYSFQNRWPVLEIKPESLAEAGFFYLQQEDRVQCPFCFVILYNWTHGDKPLREHMKKSPKCPFLVGSDVDNVPMLPEKHKPISVTPVSEKKYSSHSVIASYKPKHPRMADVKRRILTFPGWPLSKPGPEQLAECGLYYSGIADVVTCFFCGGTLGNWEPVDDPWEEHTKFFPDCSFLAVAKNKYSKPGKKPAASVKKNHEQKIQLDNEITSSHGTSGIIKQALDIFPEPLVLDAVKRKGGLISSLQDLCDDILELKQPTHHGISLVVPAEECENSKKKSEDGSTSSDLLCKLCADRERGVVFQPCGHLVSCWQCSDLIADCPVCRKPIIHKIRTYIC